MTARAMARRLIDHEQGAGRAPSDAVAVAERAVRRLSDMLAGWFGPYVVHALLTRALAGVRADHPSLAAARVGVPPASTLEGLADGARAHGRLAVAAGTGAVLAVVIELLGRLIGDDLATSLVEQSLRDDASTNGLRHGRAGDGSGTEAEAEDVGGTLRDVIGNPNDD